MSIRSIRVIRVPLKGGNVAPPGGYRKIIRAFYTVYNTLGYGFLEKVYENALAHELAKQGLEARQQVPVRVYYDGLSVGEYWADMVVEGCVIVELKAAESLRPEHAAQLVNYLKATEMEVGLLFNFGPKPEFTRKLFTNDRKGWMAKK